MHQAHRKQSFQDWATQQWVISFGRKIDPKKHDWLLGPFGNTNGIGLKFIEQLAKRENLTIVKDGDKRGLLRSVHQLMLSEKELDELSEDVINFYERTNDYDLDFSIQWNPVFKGFGSLLKILFSNRIEQLNLPTKNPSKSNTLKSEIIHLVDDKSCKVKRTIWLRSFKESGQVIYSGIYETCILPSGQTCIKAIFPLPHGNATVILNPSVGENGELILKSEGNKFSDSGFYFLLNDSNGQLWAKYISSFRDTIIASSKNNEVEVVQTLTFFRLTVLKMEYLITKKVTTSLTF